VVDAREIITLRLSRWLRGEDEKANNAAVNAARFAEVHSKAIRVQRNRVEVHMKVKVSEVMTRGVEKISAAATIEEAAKQMKIHNVGILPVVDDNSVVGVVTDRDLVLRAVATRLRPEMTRVRDVMTRKAISCYEDENIAEASQLMEQQLVHRLIALDRNDELVGIVSLSDLAARARSEKLSGHVLSKVSAA
jgi:CBS domain-containing protein